MKKYEAQGLANLPICVAKTQYSLSDQPTLLGRPSGFTVKINDLIPVSYTHLENIYGFTSVQLLNY